MRTIGILGGMGPAATAHFFGRLVARARAERDQDHPPCLLFNAAHIPDRSTHIAGEGPDPTPELRAAARVLEGAGAEFLAIPCNCAHVYHAAVQDAVEVPVLNMIELAAAQARDALGEGGVAVLAATGTVATGLYDAALEAVGLRSVRPTDAEQAIVMGSIRAVKAGATAVDPDLAAVADVLVARGADLLVLGCTELPIAFDVSNSPVATLDATEVLVAECLRQAGARLHPEG